MVSLDTTFAHSSIFLYTLATCIITIYFLQPFLDWISGKKLERFIAIRAIFILAGMQIIIFTFCIEMKRVFSIMEDVSKSFQVKFSCNLKSFSCYCSFNSE